MKLTQRSLFIVLLQQGFSGFIGNAIADEAHSKALPFAGTFLSTRMDVAGPDGNPAAMYTVQIAKGKGHIKSSTLQGIVEDIPMGATAECPGGLYIIDADNGLGGGSGTRSFINGKDQIYTAHAERQLCVDEFGKMSGQDKGLIVGGTGKYAGVTGSWELKHTGIIQYSDFSSQPIQYFGSIAGSIAGSGNWEIQFPN